MYCGAHRALEEGNSRDARARFAEVIRALDEIEKDSILVNCIAMIKASLYADFLGDRAGARRELTRALAIDPDSTRAKALRDRLNAEEVVRRTAPASDAPKLILATRPVAKEQAP